MRYEIQPTAGLVARAARERLGLTQAQVAERIDLVPCVYGRIERGDMTPSAQTLRRICLVLGISADAVLNLDSGRGDDESAEEGRSPELQRILGQIRDWSPKRLKVLSRVLTVVTHTEEN